MTSSIAPMMDVTNRHFRFVMRMLTKRTLLYTEMKGLYGGGGGGGITKSHRNQSSD
jgi:hypothetical protein